MGQIKWYKRDPSAALNGMMELTLEERGAYNTVLDLIYSRDGNLPDDDRFIAGWLMVDIRVWKRIKKRLFERGKLFAEDGNLRNARADVEVLAALSRVGSAREAGLASAASKASKSPRQTPENNNLASTPDETDDPTPVSTNYSHNQKERDKSLSGDAPARRAPKRAVKLPTDWEPVLTPAAQRIVDGWPPGKLGAELQRFRDHAADKGRVSKDWQAAFRTWLTKADEWMRRDGRSGQPRGPQPRSGDGSVDYLLNRIQAGGPR